MLVIRIGEFILFHTEVAYIINRIIGKGIGLVGHRRYATTHASCYETLSKHVLMFWRLVFLYWRGGPRTLSRVKFSLLLLQLCCIAISRKKLIGIIVTTGSRRSLLLITKMSMKATRHCLNYVVTPKQWDGLTQRDFV